MINKQTVIKVCNFSSLILEKITEIDYNNTSTVNLLSVVTKKRIKDLRVWKFAYKMELMSNTCRQVLEKVTFCRYKGFRLIIMQRNKRVLEYIRVDMKGTMKWNVIIEVYENEIWTTKNEFKMIKQ